MTQQQIEKDKFKIVGGNHEATEKLADKSVSFWKEVFLRFSHNKMAIVGIIILIIVILMAIFAPMLSQYKASDQLGVYNAPPSAQFWFGTDDLGRDIFVRIWEGARISLFIGIAAAVIDLIIGVIWGSISGLSGGRVDNIMMRIADVLTAVPYLLVVIVLLVVMQPGLFPMIIALSITGWINMARIVRGEVLSIKNQEYVLAARTLGASTGHLIIKHLVPNALGAILVTMTLTIPSAIFTESFLSYLGLGVPAPTASWGTMASDGNKAIANAPWRLIFPAVFISLTIFAFNAVGDGLRDALDPKLRK
ncbi:ABC transporter permease [Lysinibacillus sp. fkY74-1]|uniref:Oligopeptide transport system permease protein n=3 Tax=Lysinibacillus TaxID=400634 RepID=B1HQD3_LYSSC|nr:MULTISPECIES: ABC transporter permease [Lysinibacillus]ACA39080.1 Oligopeptide transport system permease protein [Lysinibacillus sphaericus C3-41]AMO34696.1 diguanylate cyclase [Lysinibacillus sphaericus]AMR90187.1 diguanylate cyclase [Lysinibacillus sphaericus]ANA44237.1 diguanylate cyclase [Lysinibacillus sphaericus]EWH34548.1 diguanylate cyclase [Lysinibacillus sphaericus CBAM5]